MLPEVLRAAEAARAATPSLWEGSDEALERALRGLAERLRSESDGILAANRDDLEAAGDSLGEALRDRLRLDDARLAGMADQVSALADLPAVETSAGHHPHGELVIEERRIPIGVVGANYEARANVTTDIASQFVKSRNGGVLRTGGAALRTATACVDLAVAPALADAGLDPGAIQIVRTPDRQAAEDLVSLPDLVPLVILRGSGPTTAHLATVAARAGVRTLAHAEGGGVLYVDAQHDRALALELVESSLDRLGVCNRLNLLLVHEALWDELLAEVLSVLERLGVAPSLPPHDHPLGHEWATDEERAATVTLASVEGPREAARVANDETSGLAAGIVTSDDAAATAFLDAYRGTGAFWNASTRWLDGFKMLSAPETGINLDRVPGPRGPVTYRDLFLRQFRVVAG